MQPINEYRRGAFPFWGGILGGFFSLYVYAARRRQKSVRGKFQFGKLCIGQQFQFFDNTLRQLPESNLIGHQVALHSGVCK